MQEFVDRMIDWLGLHREPGDLELRQICLRAAVMFFVALAMLRVAHKRFFARRNAMDVLLTFILASTLARAINGSAPFLPTIAAGFLLVLLHRGVSWLAARSSGFARLVKGESSCLVENGVVREAELRRHDLDREDLTEDLRISGVAEMRDVERAILERNGAISVQKRGRNADAAPEGT